MDKVYVVTMGDYDDYHIEAIFTNQEAAEKRCAVLSGVNRDVPVIEEWDISDGTKIECEKVYKAIFFIMYENGRFSSISMRYSTEPFAIDICKDRRKDYRNFPCNIRGISGYIPVNESIYDCDAAKKIINDHVAKWKAEQAGL